MLIRARVLDRDNTVIVCINLCVTGDRASKPPFKDPFRELFIYAVLNKFDAMSHLFWEEGRETIAAALTASKLLKGMVAKVRTRDMDLKEDLMALAV